MPISHGELQRLASAIQLQEQGRLAEAAGAYALLLQDDPDSPVLLHLLGRARGYLGHVTEGEVLLRRCAEIDPTLQEVWADLATFLRCQGRIAEAGEAARNAVQAAPDNAWIHSDFLLTIENDPLQSQEHVWIERLGWANRHAHVPLEMREVTNRDPDRKLRLGYVSADFALHSAMFTIGPIITSHSDDFEVYCYSGVTDAAEDLMTAWLKENVTAWRPAWKMDDGALAEQIRRDEIDILVDLSGHTFGNRLTMFARHPAPIQVTAWGYPTGTGMQQMDYLFADDICVPPEQEQYYMEEVVRLPSFICYAPPEHAPKPGKLPKGICFGLMNNPRKLDPITLATWARIGQAIPEATFLYQSSQWLPNEAIERLFSPLAEAGITADRIHIIPPQPIKEHLLQLQRVTINLDPLHYGGGMTTLDAAYMGIPTLTMAGGGFPGRTSASIMAQLNLSEYITESPDEYVQRAVEVTRSRKLLGNIRKNLRHALEMSHLGNRKRYMEAVEDTYRSLWHRYLAGEQPRMREVA
jgi:protein O-GlcNAc transferase